ncbi:MULTISPECIES: monofunctional biosynthetic peptidoglycan transglycosylase [Polynucleobacter]|jgi:monofunctional biosynthetic peptidoglycan transglycosylase|uniref:Biosynthetic peptidoglycan transglycosylase n=1 Tax=Polynucleobacter yangtzensis TaxID=1743159 RepID=A0ABM8CKH3_9BURK|nr:MULTISPECIES: monofunctional biosynthetic peptidoglycan transglycosylase [Polynucleobacter]MCX7238472.1 monofunctional biosynthetic peptidoglycan transglycosylase [Polynucleobacter sp.]BDT78332.1 monofunctional biosynthetic peptidoglycan transglycosylase [Polynucleobacter yangtzensis]
MRWLLYPVKCLLAGFVAMQIFFALQIALWIGLDPSSTAFQRAERWRLCSWHWSCSVQSRWVSYDKISNNLKRAVLVSEDDIFFQHSGVRVEDMQKAWQKNQQQNQQKTQAGNKSKIALRGGSTITQQLAKNLFLSSEQNYFRKGQELIITGLLELTLSKQRMYEIYLNSVEWGEGIFGVGAASQHYYATSPAALDRNQSAALASALPAPKCFDKQQYCRRGSINYSARQEFILEGMDRVALAPYPKK